MTREILGSCINQYKQIKMLHCYENAKNKANLKPDDSDAPQRHPQTSALLLAVAETGSFTMAASRLFMTQSALTATIQQFEEAVGLKMFDRTTRRVAMTDHAERFIAEARKVVHSFDGAIGDLTALAQGERGHIRIGAAASVI